MGPRSGSAAYLSLGHFGCAPFLKAPPKVVLSRGAFNPIKLKAPLLLKAPLFTKLKAPLLAPLPKQIFILSVRIGKHHFPSSKSGAFSLKAPLIHDFRERTRGALSSDPRVQKVVLSV